MAKQVAYGEATLRDAAGVLISRATGTFLLHRPDPDRETRARRLTPIRVPPPGTGVCGICCGPSGPHGVCFACRRVGHRLGLALAPVFPVRLCPLPGPLYTVLMGYEESPVHEAAPQRFGPMSARWSADFGSSHTRCLAASAGGPCDVVLPVPSSARPHGVTTHRRGRVGVRLRPGSATGCRTSSSGPRHPSATCGPRPVP